MECPLLNLANKEVSRLDRLKKVAANIGLSEIVEELERGHDWTVFFIFWLVNFKRSRRLFQKSSGFVDNELMHFGTFHTILEGKILRALLE